MEDRSGYVYLLKAHKPFDECYKIGRTKDPKRRLKDFGVKLPYKVEVVCLISAGDMVSGEASLHEWFEHRRVDGEWFRLSAVDVEYVKSIGLTIEARIKLQWILSLQPRLELRDGFELSVGLIHRWGRAVTMAAARVGRRINQTGDLGALTAQTKRTPPR